MLLLWSILKDYLRKCVLFVKLRIADKNVVGTFLFQLPERRTPLYTVEPLYSNSLK